MQIIRSDHTLRSYASIPNQSPIDRQTSPYRNRTAREDPQEADRFLGVFSLTKLSALTDYWLIMGR